MVLDIPLTIIQGKLASNCQPTLIMAYSVYLLCHSVCGSLRHDEVEYS